MRESEFCLAEVWWENIFFVDEVMEMIFEEWGQGFRGSKEAKIAVIF